MRRFVRVALALVALKLVGATTAQAEKRIALLIGNADNKAGAGVLANPLNDIRIVGAALKSIGFEVMEPVQNARRADMVLTINDFTAQLKAAGPDAIGFLYYSGHGVASEGENYLVPIDIEEPSTRLLRAQGQAQRSSRDLAQ